ncbi:MAG: glycosyltransferase family 39 protein [Acidobacteriia bacterium]|nr:glycosyltransferase family 39 protein [Terriglobia bacterium]
MKASVHEGGPSQSVLLPPCLIALAYILLHMVTASRYGYFRDALYYIACSNHLDWGYVDHPPLIVFVAWISRHTLGLSLPALLVWPAAAGAARIVLTAVIARELGTRRFGVALAALLAAVPGVWMVSDHQFSMNAFEPLFWGGCAYVVLRMIRSDNPRLWLAFGAIAGLGLENKYSIAVFAFALIAGLFFTPQRKLLFTPWLLAGGAVALLFSLPNLLWNIHHHWPFLELMHNIHAAGKDIVLSPVDFLLQQALIMSPTTSPFWFGGLFFYLFSRDAKPFRAFGWAFVLTITFFLVAHGKNYYSAPVYPIVLAAGAFVVERSLASSRLMEHFRLRSILKPAMFLWLLAGVILFLPVTLPVLSVEAFLRYQSHLPFEVPHSENSQKGTALPQYYADEFGWPEMVAAVARVYESLPPEDRARTAILTNNYGEAAAIDFFGLKYGLPKAICPHQSYFLWGPRNSTGEIVIRVGATIDTVRPSYANVIVAATLDNPYAYSYEIRPILLCRGLKTDLQVLWPKLKIWQ